MWRESDRDAFAEMNSNPRVMRYFPRTLSRQDSDALFARIRAHIDRHGFGLFAVELRETGAFAGFIGLTVPTLEAHFVPCVEIGWRLLPEFWNRGLATEGARAALANGFDNLKLDEIVSFTTVSNLPSRRVMEKLGMRHDPADDFDHPGIPAGNPLRAHVLYRLRRPVA